MKKFLYIMPSVLICMLYTVLTILAGGIGGYQPIVLIYLGFPILAAIFLRKGKWWGGLFGMAVGGILLYMASQDTGQTIDIERSMGLVFLVYYFIMSLVCYKANKKQ